VQFADRFHRNERTDFTMRREMLERSNPRSTERVDEERRAAGLGHPGRTPQPPPRYIIRDLNLFYGAHQALKNITLDLRANEITALIGPSGCGKSTFLRVLNRMNEMIAGVRTEGKVLLDGEDIFGGRIDVVHLRKRVGMVFQKPNPFPKTIFDNVAYGPRLHGTCRKGDLEECVGACAGRPCGTRSRIICVGRHWSFPAANSNDSASPVPWRWTRRCS